VLENHLLICVTHFQGEFSGILEMRQAMGHPFCPSRVLHPFLDDPVIREAIVQSVKSADERENVARCVTVSPLSLGAL